jgi:hypothetical protein
MTLLKLSLLSALFGEPNLERLLLGEVNDCKASVADCYFAAKAIIRGLTENPTLSAAPP